MTRSTSFVLRLDRDGDFFGDELRRDGDDLGEEGDDDDDDGDKGGDEDGDEEGDDALRVAVIDADDDDSYDDR